jgi:hypothetical protein
MLYQRPDFSPSMLYNHKTMDDILQKRIEFYELKERREELQSSLDERSISALREEVSISKIEFNKLIEGDIQKELDNVYRQTNELKESPIYRDVCSQREQIRLLRQTVEVQVEKYRRKKIEYRALKENPDISKTRTQLSQTISRDLTSGSSQFVTIVGVSKYTTEDDIRTVFDIYGFIYDIAFDGNGNVIIEFDEGKAALEAVECTSRLFKRIILGKGDNVATRRFVDVEEDYNDISDDYSTEVGMKRSSIIFASPKVASAPRNFR